MINIYSASAYKQVSFYRCVSIRKALTLSSNS
jgi:hypothetical protein